MKNAQRAYSKKFNIVGLGRDDKWKARVAAEQKRLALSISEKDSTFLKRCPICRHGSFSEFAKIYGYLYGECESCGHIFLVRVPNEAIIRKLYVSEEEKSRTQQADIYINEELFLKRIEMIANPKVGFINECLPFKGKWIDVGCGVGEILIAAQNSGWDVLGIEGDAEEVAFARRHGVAVENIYVDEKNRAQLFKNADVVSFFNILEHVANPNNFLKMISFSLKAGAHVAIEVPRHPSLSSLAIKAYPNIAMRHIYPPDHLHIFTENSVGKILQDCQLHPTHIWLFGQDYYEVVTCLSHGLLSPDSEFFKKLIFCVDDIQSAIDSSGLSDSMIVLSRKI